MVQPTLENQIEDAKIRQRREYLSLVLREMQGERSQELYRSLLNVPPFTQRDAVRLLAKIETDYEVGEPTPARYVRKPENIAPFAYLALLELVEVKIDIYFRIFKKRTVVPKSLSY